MNLVKSVYQRTFLGFSVPRKANEEDVEAVGLLLNKIAKHNLLDWKPVSGRIALLKCHIRNVTVKQSYAPIE